MKYQRTYALTIQVDSPRHVFDTQLVETIVIRFPLTLNFDIVRGTFQLSNTGHFRIFNLAPETRNLIFHDRNQSVNYKQITLEAGYEGQAPLPIIFKGNILAAYSRREGTDWVTDIEALDGGDAILNGQVNQTASQGWNLRSLLKAVIQTMPNVSTGAIGSLGGSVGTGFTEQGSSRGITLMGNSWDVLNVMAGSRGAPPFIDNERAHVLTRDEYIEDAASLPLISADTGLLQTPKRSDKLLEATTLFEPRLQVGQRVELQSIEKVYNGYYKILGVSHRGTISGAVSGDAITTVSMDLGKFILTAVPQGEF